MVARIGVALSGGGHRAALFGLGALLYLADAGKSREIVSVASVSGGSLTNAFLAQRIDLEADDGAGVRDVARELANRIALLGTVWSPISTKLFIALLAVALAVPFGPWLLPWRWPARLAASLGGLLLWGLLAQQRGRVGGYALGRTLFSRGGRPGLLHDIHNRVDHVICATDIYPGEHIYFSGHFVCSYRLGWGHPDTLRLHQAVMASAALPGAFPVQWLPTSRHGFEGGQVQRPWMALADGGVYDNMADQWGQDIDGRKDRWTQAKDLRSIDELIIINASAGLEETNLSRLRIPFLGELLSLFRDIDVLYDNSTSLRRQALVGRFDLAAVTGKDLKGALVHIPQSPFKVPSYFAESEDWPDRKNRALQALQVLSGEDSQQWSRVVRDNQRVKTSLSKIGAQRTGLILRHAYILTMINLHVILDYPLLPLPPIKEFEALAEGRQETPR
jgi:predicted acylesterase/phospholipase RssA